MGGRSGQGIFLCSQGPYQKFGTLPVLSDGVVLIEDVAEVKCVAFANIFNSEVINNEGGQNRLSLVKPEVRCRGSLIVAGFVEACGE